MVSSDFKKIIPYSPSLNVHGLMETMDFILMGNLSGARSNDLRHGIRRNVVMLAKNRVSLRETFA